MDSEAYQKAIVSEFNKWNEVYHKTEGVIDSMTESGVAAFMCNAIAVAVAKSNQPRLKELFDKEADF